MQEFDIYQHNYKQQLQQAVSFSGANIDFYTSVKANCLISAARKHWRSIDKLKVLNVGCGPGLVDFFIGGFFAQIWGVDASLGMAKEARRRNPSSTYLVSDGCLLPFQSSSFDLAFAINVMHHVRPHRWLEFLQEMQRVARQGGLVAIFEHNPINPLTRVVTARCAFDRDAVLLGPGRAKQLFKRAGLKALEHRYVLFFPFSNEFVQKLEKMFAWLPLGAQYYVLGKKEHTIC